METKKVNIYPSTPIVSVTPPIRTTVKGATKKIETIRKCIIARAKVEEVLPTGDTVILDLSNYDKDNRFNTESKMDIPETPADPIVPDAPVVEEPVKEEPTKEEETVVEEAPVVEESVKEEPVKDEETVVEEAPVVEDPANDTEETVEEDAEDEEIEAPDVDEINAALDDIDTSDIADEDDGLSDDEQGL